MKRIIVLVALILDTLYEVDPSPAPSGVIFAGVNSAFSFDEYTEAVRCCVEAGWVVNRAHQLSLTGEGRHKAREIQACKQ